MVKTVTISKIFRGAHPKTIDESGGKKESSGARKGGGEMTLENFMKMFKN